MGEIIELNTVTITLDEFINLRDKANLANLIQDRIFYLDGRINELEWRVKDLEAR